MKFNSPSEFCKSLRSTAIAISAFLAVGMVHASVVVDFNGYNTGQLQGQAGGTGLSGNWEGNIHNDVVSGDLSGPAGSTSLIYAQTGTPQSLKVPDGNNAGSSQFATSQTTIVLGTPFTGVTWISFVAQTATGQRLVLGLNQNPSASPPAPTVSSVSSDVPIWVHGGDQQVQIRTESATIIGFSPYSLALGTSFIVARVDPTAATENVDVWVNPTSYFDFSGTPDIANVTAPITGSAITNFSVGGYNATTPNRMDNIRMGTSLNDVVVVAVPEPQTLSFFLIGTAILIYLRRVFMTDQRIA